MKVSKANPLRKVPKRYPKGIKTKVWDFLANPWQTLGKSLTKGMPNRKP